MRPSEDQQKVLDSLLDWYENKRGYITVGGYAGTGKSTLLGFLRKELYKRHPYLTVAFCAFTGKAAWNLRTKLKYANAIYSHLDSCSTIHKLMYIPVIDEDTGEILKWIPATEIRKDLIIVDEASMVSEEIFKDLMKYGIPIIAVGDHGQLPPIGDSFNLMNNPDLRLEKIHRQAENNPIIHVSKIIREEGRLRKCGSWGDFLSGGVKRINKDSNESYIVDEMFKKYDKNMMILSGTNRERVNLNQYIRSESLGIKSQIPVIGDRVICLKNNGNASNIPIYNGMCGNIEEINDLGKDHYKMQVKLDGEKCRYIGNVSTHFFNNEYGEEPKNLHYTEIGDRFDFGYCLTVHKAQGSESDNVILFERPRWRSETEDMYTRWLYTGVTRAIENLLIVT